MYVATIPNRNSPPAILLRESFRHDGKVKNRTLANLSDWPAQKIEALRIVLKGGGTPGLPLEEAFDIVRSRPHGHVAAVLGTLRRCGLSSLLRTPQRREQNLWEALIVGRILEPRSKLATARLLREETLASSLGEVLDVADTDEDELYQAMDRLLPRQHQIEARLAKKHLHEGTLALYDVTSSYFEGRHCPLAQLGHSRDDKKGRPQIVIGLLCNSEGCPVAVEVFEGNTADPKTVKAQVEKLRQRFELERVVLVGDRGMLTSARIKTDVAPHAGLDWISSLRAPQIRALVTSGALQLSLFDEQDLAEIESPDYPGERLVVCRNPLLAEERRRKRNEMLAATERKLTKVVEATMRPKRALRGKQKIALRVGRMLSQSKMGKHFQLVIEEDRFSYSRNEVRIEQEAQLDGIYVIRTSVPEKTMAADTVVSSYKRLAQVERAFRSLKTVDLKVRPIYHWNPDRVRAHVFICMLAYYVEWHMRASLAPLLFQDDDPQGAAAQRKSAVAPAQVSPRARRKAQTKRTAEDEPVHSFQTLLADLATIVKNRVQPKAPKGAPPFDLITRPTVLQKHMLDLLGVSLML
jgi:transposase